MFESDIQISDRKLPWYPDVISRYLLTYGNVVINQNWKECMFIVDS